MKKINDPKIREIILSSGHSKFDLIVNVYKRGPMLEDTCQFGDLHETELLKWFMDTKPGWVSFTIFL